MKKLKKIIHEHKYTFSKYLITGTLTVIFNNLILGLMLISTDFNEIWSILFSVFIIILFGFLINTTYTFKSKMTLLSLSKYILLVAVNLIVLKFTTIFFLSFGINVFIVSLLNTARVVPLNYISFKYLVFK